MKLVAAVRNSMHWSGQNLAC